MTETASNRPSTTPLGTDSLFGPRGIDLRDHTLGIHHDRDAVGVVGTGVAARAVHHAQRLVGIAQQREGIGELVAERLVLLDGVERRADNTRTQLLEVADSITESAALDGSTRCVGLDG